MTIAQKAREEQITLRSVTEADDHFLLSVYTKNASQEMAFVPWSAEQKEIFVRMQYTAEKDHYTQRIFRRPHMKSYVLMDLPSDGCI